MNNLQFNQLNLPDELLGDILHSAKVTVAWGVEGEVGVRATAVIATTGSHIADVPECPTSGCRSSWNIARIGLEEVHLIQRCAVSCSGQECEEDEQDGSGHEEQAEEAQRRSY